LTVAGGATSDPPPRPRLGELLVAAGLLTVEQVEQALRAQVMWGGRLGTNIVELRYLDLDPLSEVVARQHRLPAALARHFDKADPELQHRLSAGFAERFSCLPLLRMGPEQHVVIASLAPLDGRQLAIVADELGVDVKHLIPSIAAELRIRYQLERVYRIRRAARFLRTRGKSIPPFPAFQILPVPAEVEPEPPPNLPISTQRDDGGERHGDLRPDEPIASTDDLDDLDDLTRHATLDDDLAVPVLEREVDHSGRERRTYVRTIADAPSSDPEPHALLGRIAIRKMAVDPTGALASRPAGRAIGVPRDLASPIGSAPRVIAGVTLGEATRAIRRGTDRDRVGELVIDTLDRFAPGCEAAIMLVIRGATAIGWKGFVRGGGALGEIAVPMEDGGLVPQAVELNVTLRRTCAELDAIDRLLLASLGRSAGDLVAVPISISDRVLCVIVIATSEGEPIAGAEPIAAAAGAAFGRLMRDASR
jgi:hypothetical protein